MEEKKNKKKSRFSGREIEILSLYGEGKKMMLC
jgi:hypothetical protein